METFFPRLPLPYIIYHSQLLRQAWPSPDCFSYFLFCSSILRWACSHQIGWTMSNTSSLTGFKLNSITNVPAEADGAGCMNELWTTNLLRWTACRRVEAETKRARQAMLLDIQGMQALWLQVCRTQIKLKILIKDQIPLLCNIHWWLLVNQPTSRCAPLLALWLSCINCTAMLVCSKMGRWHGVWSPHLTSFPCE